jgi:hypothetical protein
MNRPRKLIHVIGSIYSNELPLVMGLENYKRLKEKNRNSRLDYGFGDYYVTNKAVYYKHDNCKSYHKIADLNIHPLIVTLLARLHITNDCLSDLDIDLLQAINDYIDPDIKTEYQFIQTLKEFSIFESPSYLVATEDIFNYVVKYSDDYSSYIPQALPKITLESLFCNSLNSVAEYIYYKITPKIINRYIYVMQ